MQIIYKLTIAGLRKSQYKYCSGNPNILGPTPTGQSTLIVTRKNRKENYWSFSSLCDYIAHKLLLSAIRYIYIATLNSLLPVLYVICILEWDKCCGLHVPLRSLTRSWLGIWQEISGIYDLCISNCQYHDILRGEFRQTICLCVIILTSN